MAKRLNYLGITAWLEPSVCIERVGPTLLRELLKLQVERGRRQARSELLTSAPGSLRITLESKSALLALR